MDVLYSNEIHELVIRLALRVFGSIKFLMYSVYWGLHFKITEFETLTAVIFSRDILFKRAGVFWLIGDKQTAVY